MEISLTTNIAHSEWIFLFDMVKGLKAKISDFSDVIYTTSKNDVVKQKH